MYQNSILESLCKILIFSEFQSFTVMEEQDKEKHKTELYIEYLEDAARELIVNFSESESALSKSLVDKGEFFFTLKLIIQTNLLNVTRLIIA